MGGHSPLIPTRKMNGATSQALPGFQMVPPRASKVSKSWPSRTVQLEECADVIGLHVSCGQKMHQKLLRPKDPGSLGSCALKENLQKTQKTLPS